MKTYLVVISITGNVTWGPTLEVSNSYVTHGGDSHLVVRASSLWLGDSKSCSRTEIGRGVSVESISNVNSSVVGASLELPCKGSF